MTIIEVSIFCSVALLNGQSVTPKFYVESMKEAKEVFEREISSSSLVYPKDKCRMETKTVPRPIPYDPVADKQKHEAKKNRIKQLKEKKMTAEEMEEVIKLLMED